MRAGIAALIFGYMLSQFTRAFLAVLTPLLETDLGATKHDLAAASGWWFLIFGAMQLPVGVAFDRIGPSRTSAACLAIGALGMVVFARASGPLEIQIAMGMIGLGCAPILMASFFLYARNFPPALFASLAGMTVGIGSLGDMLASLPMAMAVDAWGWRAVLWVTAGVMALTAGSFLVLVRDPPRVQSENPGSLINLLRIPALWPIISVMLVCYVAPAAMRGLWLGPYFHDVWGFSSGQLGQVGLLMGLALVVGSLVIGPLERWLGTIKWLVVAVNAGMILALSVLTLAPQGSATVGVAMFVLVGLFGTTFPMITAHARQLIPVHLIGRGVTFVNLCGIATVGLAQQITGRMHDALADPADPAAPFAMIFGFFAVTTAIGLLFYLPSREEKA